GRAAGVDRAPGRAPRELIVGGHAASLGVPQVVKWTTADALCPPSVATTFTTWSWPEESVTSNDVPACSKDCMSKLWPPSDEYRTMYRSGLPSGSDAAHVIVGLPPVGTTVDPSDGPVIVT